MKLQSLGHADSTAAYAVVNIVDKDHGFTPRSLGHPTIFADPKKPSCAHLGLKLMTHQRCLCCPITRHILIFVVRKAAPFLFCFSWFMAWRPSSKIQRSRCCSVSFIFVSFILRSRQSSASRRFRRQRPRTTPTKSAMYTTTLVSKPRNFERWLE